ncbi:MAG: aminoacyl-tRNA hydrolase [Chromatiales bacterium]
MGITLIVGLGNPGPDYAPTRHNVGFWFADRLAAHAAVGFRREAKFHGEVCRGLAATRECWLLKPLTFMNLSGDSVAEFARFYHIPSEEILVAHDELDLPPGTVRLKWGGGDGGHNGLSDIIAKLATSDFYRMRIGIGHPGMRELVTPYLLHSRPSEEERTAINQSIALAVGQLPLLVAGEFDKVMNTLNRRKREADAGGESEA